MLLKGASEIVLAACENWMSGQNGQTQPITTELLEEMKESIVSMAKKSLRTLCFAFKYLSEN